MCGVTMFVLTNHHPKMSASGGLEIDTFLVRGKLMGPA